LKETALAQKRQNGNDAIFTLSLQNTQFTMTAVDIPPRGEPFVAACEYPIVQNIPATLQVSPLRGLFYETNLKHGHFSQIGFDSLGLSLIVAAFFAGSGIGRSRCSHVNVNPNVQVVGSVWVIFRPLPFWSLYIWSKTYNRFNRNRLKWSER
jgi:hypothetical protein